MYIVSFKQGYSLFSVLGFIIRIAPAFFWLLNSKRSFIGFWSLPTSLLFSWVCIVGIITCAFVWMRTHRRYDFCLLTLNIVLFFGDFRVRLPLDEGTPILTWNIEGKALVDSQQQRCTLDYLKDWGSENPNGVVVLQEVRYFQKKIFSEELEKDCIWAPYHKKRKNRWSQNGLMVCISSDDWKVRRPHHRDFTGKSSYGFLQMEIIDVQSKRTYNIMNVHLESLYTSAKELSSYPGGNSISSVVHSIWNTGAYGFIFDLMKQNAQAQEMQLKEIKDVLVQLKDPTIIAGDFNSPPEQWHHRNLRLGYTDAHRQTGWGFGVTVRRLGLIHSRVDYLYASKELLWSGQTIVNSTVHCSDHFPTHSKFDLYQ